MGFGIWNGIWNGIWDWNGIWNLEIEFRIWKWDLTSIGFGILLYPNNMGGKYNNYY